MAAALAIGAVSGGAIAQAAPAAQRPQAAAAAPAVPTISRSDFIRDMDIEFSKVDADKNGGVTAKEIQDFVKIAALAQARARNAAYFVALDTDKNGQLSPVEFARLPMNLEAPPIPVSLAFDTNRDGTVSKVENRAGTLANFDRLDTDKDGFVSPAEMRAAGVAR